MIFQLGRLKTRHFTHITAPQGAAGPQLEAARDFLYHLPMPTNSFLIKLEWIEKNFVEVLPTNEIVLDLKYATDDNFMNANLYDSFDRCFLSQTAFEKLQAAATVLKKQHPELQFRIWDALRPASIQSQMFEHLQGTPFETYVAAPEPGSMHNFGMAVDLSLQTKDGELLEMGTDFDHFAELAQPIKEDHFLKTGELSSRAYAHRLLLRRLLEAQGFQVLPHEWWHFNALPADKVYGQFPKLI